VQRTVHTPDGRVLAVEEAGDPAGRPVLVHNGTPNSRHLYGPDGRDAAERGLRLIGYDRPGYGGSSPQPGMGQGNVDDTLLVLNDEPAARAKAEKDREEILAESPGDADGADDVPDGLQTLLSPVDAAVLSSRSACNAKSRTWSRGSGAARASAGLVGVADRDGRAVPASSRGDALLSPSVTRTLISSIAGRGPARSVDASALSVLTDRACPDAGHRHEDPPAARSRLGCGRQLRWLGERSGLGIGARSVSAGLTGAMRTRLLYVTRAMARCMTISTATALGG
jgi:pimeloyl-ACP methyl ester carboxylesterase